MVLSFEGLGSFYGLGFSWFGIFVVLIPARFGVGWPLRFIAARALTVLLPL